MVEPKRALSESEIRRCENAKEDKCVCRCGGTLHGAGRVAVDAVRSAFEALPVEDPHHLLTKQEARTAAKQRAHLRAMHAYHKSLGGGIGYVRTVGVTNYYRADQMPCPLCLAEGRPFKDLCAECGSPIYLVRTDWPDDSGGDQRYSQPVETWKHWVEPVNMPDHGPVVPRIEEPVR